MKITMILLGLVSFFEIVDYLIAAEEMNLIVSSMFGYENDYLRLKRRHPSLKRPREEKFRFKEDICVAIIGSDFFDAHNVEAVNPNHKTIYKHIKQHHSKVYEEHFKSGHSSEVIKPKFANPYTLRDISVLGNFIKEFVFTCIARNCSTKNIEQYFVSPEYDLNGASEMIRFVFAYNKKQELVVIAKAENMRTPTGFTAATSAAKTTTTTKATTTTTKATTTRIATTTTTTSTTRKATDKSAHDYDASASHDDVETNDESESW